MSTAYSYDADYLARLTGGWNKLSFPLIAPLVRDTLSNYAPQRILDFGSGAGTYAEVLAETGGEVAACDISPQSIVACQGKYAQAFVLDDPAKLPTNAFEFIFSTEVLEHIKDYGDTIDNFHRALRPGGTVFLTTTCYSTSLFTMLYQAKKTCGPRELMREIGRWMAGYFSASRRAAFVERWCFEPLGGHYHGFLRGKLLGRFKEAGFTVISSGVFYAIEPIHLPFLYSHTLQGLARKKGWSIPKRLAAMSIFVIAHPLNRLLKSLGLFANNVYVVAKKA